MHIYMLLLFASTVVCNVMDTYLRGKKDFQYDYYEDINLPASLTAESMTDNGQKLTNLCSLIPPSPMYCKCADRKMDVTCFVFAEVAINDMVWDLFGDQHSITKLRFVSRPEDSLTFVPNYAFGHLKNLQTLSFSQSRLTEIQSFGFARLPRLVAIELANNKITNFQKKSFAHLHNLVELILSENLLSQLEVEMFVDLPRLRVLFIDRNNITRIENRALAEMPNLSELELWGNGLTDVNPDIFFGLTKLHHLDVSFNKITKLPANLFKHAPRLEEVKLEHNMISIIDENAFEGLENLLRLRLAGNQLVSIGEPTPFARLSRLMIIDLRDNQLRTLSRDSVFSLTNIQNTSAFVHINGNPFDCSCELIWMTIAMNSTEMTPFREELNSVQCTLPSRTLDRLYLIEVPWHDLGCHPTKQSTTPFAYEISVISPPSTSVTKKKTLDETDPAISQSNNELSDSKIARPPVIDNLGNTSLTIITKPNCFMIYVALMLTNLFIII